MKSIIASVVLVALGILSLVIAVFHFWVFPNLIIVLSSVSWITVSSEFINAIYWLIVGLIVLFTIKSTQLNFKD